MGARFSVQALGDGFPCLHGVYAGNQINMTFEEVKNGAKRFCESIPNEIPNYQWVCDHIDSFPSDQRFTLVYTSTYYNGNPVKYLIRAEDCPYDKPQVEAQFNPHFALDVPEGKITLQTSTTGDSATVLVDGKPCE
jgi:hypothetical protein